MIELDLMTEAQHAELPEDEDVTAADRLIIDSPTATGLDRAQGAGAGARPDGSGAGHARGIELQGADRTAGEAGRAAAAAKRYQRRPGERRGPIRRAASGWNVNVATSAASIS